MRFLPRSSCAARTHNHVKDIPRNIQRQRANSTDAEHLPKLQCRVVSQHNGRYLAGLAGDVLLGPHLLQVRPLEARLLLEALPLLLCNGLGLLRSDVGILCNGSPPGLALRCASANVRACYGAAPTAHASWQAANQMLD